MSNVIPFPRSPSQNLVEIKDEIYHCWCGSSDWEIHSDRSLRCSDCDTPAPFLHFDPSQLPTTG